MNTKSTLFNFSKSNRMKRNFYFLVSLLLLTQLPLSGQPPCNPADGNMVTQNCARIIVRNLNVACNTTVPNFLAGATSDCDTLTPGIQPRWKTVTGAGWTAAPLIQVPAAGTIINLPKDAICPTQTMSVTIIGVFTNDNGTPGDPTDDIVCQIDMPDFFNVQDVIAPTLNLPATVNVNADVNTSSNAAME